MVLKQILFAVSLHLFDRTYSKNSKSRIRKNCFLFEYILKCFPLMLALLLQLSVSHDPSEIMLIVAQYIFILCFLLLYLAHHNHKKS